MQPFVVKRGMVVLWALYLTIVTITNLCDAAVALGILPTTWAFRSGNFAAMLKTTSVYSTPLAINAVLFAGVIAWEALAAGLLWHATRAVGVGEASDWLVVYRAFGVGIALWAAFIVVDEFFLEYALQSKHLLLFIGQLLTLLALYLLPDRVSPRAP